MHIITHLLSPSDNLACGLRGTSLLKGSCPKELIKPLSRLILLLPLVKLKEQRYLVGSKPVQMTMSGQHVMVQAGSSQIHFLEYMSKVARAEASNMKKQMTAEHLTYKQVVEAYFNMGDKAQ